MHKMHSFETFAQSLNFEFPRHVQEKWAQEYSRKLREKESGGGGDAAVRNFASVVPTIGENNEAISIRQNLPPAAPTKTSAGRPQQQLHLFEVLNYETVLFVLSKQTNYLILMNVAASDSMGVAICC